MNPLETWRPALGPYFAARLLTVMAINGGWLDALRAEVATLAISTLPEVESA